MTITENAGSLISARSAVPLAKAVLCSCALMILTSLQAVRAQDPVSCTKAGIGPQSPRDLTKLIAGTNPVTFAKAPSADKMHLCNVHFHQFAEHKGTEYSGEAGKGDNKGFSCNKAKPKANAHGTACAPKGAGHGTALAVGDTIEVHWVFTSCDVKPGPGLGGCASCANAQLRVEARVFYLTDDATAGAFADQEGKIALPAAAKAVEYLGSTTGSENYAKPANCSPLPVTWNVSQACTPLKISSVGDWCAKENVYKEDHAHGVRPLVKDAKLLSPVK
jgi:Delta carbonic anhydrase